MSRVSDEDRKIIDDAIDRLRLSMEAESMNRDEAMQAIRFSYGEQWLDMDIQSRQLERRPCLTINKVDAFCRQVANQQRQQRPRIKVHPVNNQADVKIAEVITGITRHIEVNSSADTAYDTAFDYALRGGWGYWRVVTDYTREDSFDQDIYIQTIDNPFSVYFDPNSTLPDGSDAEFCLITDLIPRDRFKKLYPGADECSFTQTGTGDTTADWITKDDIRIAEYFYTEAERAQLCLLSDGSTAWFEDLPDAAVLAAVGITIVSTRESLRKTVKWCKLTAMEVLEKRTWPGRWIPVIPTYGNVAVISGKRKKFGIVKNAIDPQRMYNAWRTSITESVAMAPKAKWLLAAGQDENFENEWAQANLAARALLRYNQRDANNEMAPPPQRVQPEPPPAGAIESAFAASQDLSAVLGIVDPAQRVSGNVSGKALNAEKIQSDNSNFHFFDNLTRSIAFTGKIILDLIPKIYNTERVMRIIGEDGRPDLVTINQPDPNDPINKVLNDVTVGEYDVVMDTGPGYNSKRIEAVEAMMPLMAGNEALFNVAGDLVFRNMDFPGADVIADRLAAANPLAQIDEKSEVPPQAQMAIKQLQAQLEQAGQQIQAMQLDAKYRGSVIQMQQEGETKRELMRQATKAHDIDSRDFTQFIKNREDNIAWMHDTHVKAQAQVSVAEIKGTIDLLLQKLDAMEAQKVADREEREVAEVAEEPF